MAGKPLTVDEPTNPLLTVELGVVLVTAETPSTTKLPDVCRIDWANEEAGTQSAAATATRAEKFSVLNFFIGIFFL